MGYNYELFRKVYDQIKRHPSHFDSGYWGVSASEYYRNDEEKREECGTVACLAGWACVFSGYDLESLTGEGIKHIGARLLGIPPEEIYYFFYCGSNSEAIARIEKILQEQPSISEPVVL